MESKKTIWTVNNTYQVDDSIYKEINKKAAEYMLGLYNEEIDITSFLSDFEIECVGRFATGFNNAQKLLKRHNKKSK